MFLLTGQSIGTSIGTPTIVTEVRSGWGRLGWGEGAWGLPADIDVSVTGQAIASSLGTVDAPNVFQVTGQVINTYLGNEATQIDVTVIPTGHSFNCKSVGTVDINFIYSVTGVSGTFSVGTAVAGASAEAPVTGQVITASLGTLYGTVWTEIDPGVSMVWTEIAA